MLGRIIGLVLALALGGGAYVILNPGGLDGQVPALGLGAFESVRLGLGIAAGLLGMALAAAALMRAPEQPQARDRLAPLIDLHGGETAGLETSDEPLPFATPSATTVLQAPALEAEPAPFPLALDSGVQPAPPVHAQPDLAPAPEPEVIAIPAKLEIVAETPPPEDFDAARDALRRHAQDEAWGPAALALQRLGALAEDDRQHALAAQDAGDFARAQGKTDDAIEAYDLALAHARMTAQQDLIADALINVGDMAYEEHRLDAAVENYEAAVALRRDLAQAGGTAEARRGLSVALERLADAREDRGHRSRALDLYRESEALAAELAQGDAARYGADLAATRQRLEELEARILA
ncbi:MAG: tetratricopeptide repeat protein [Phenylobacterium sp.]|uniref:tetratricopeptide repeat protein n=1 Tax=Phenylobacterium sp. TaxID=1871053 RepID=UPI002727E361|nr:tetratricopeptide repeat protein [Phenylobacterium sp.]MDO8409858.1 tetratricopeptide repeat protein [Phenylobacterium sp.]